jgi:glycosyltransferase involved in cell wall biosynthesis
MKTSCPGTAEQTRVFRSIGTSVRLTNSEDYKRYCGSGSIGIRLASQREVHCCGSRTTLRTQLIAHLSVMKISLILATKGRVDEIKILVRSLIQQDYGNLELIVVDQNGDDRLAPILKESNLPFPILHLRSEVGLSRARNVGLAFASGDIIAFPDDDCWYPDGLLKWIVSELQSQPSVDGLTGRSEDGLIRSSGGTFSRHKGRVDIRNVWQKGVSYTIFLRSAVCAAVGPFDEELGVGARSRFGSGEETDYLIRTAKLGFNVQYLPDLIVFHPNSRLYDRNHRAKAFRYGMGMGRVLSKHRYTFTHNFCTILRPLGGALLSLLSLRPRKAAYHLAIARGRLCGLLWSVRQAP